jgi:hypothetical protein
MAGVEPLPKREQQRQGIPARVGSLVEVVEEGAGERLSPRLGRHPDAGDGPGPDFPPAEPDVELKEERVSEYEPASLGDEELIEAPELVTGENPPSGLDPARIGEGAQMNLDQAIEVIEGGGSDREEAAQRTAGGYTKMALSGAAVVGPDPNRARARSEARSTGPCQLAGPAR